MPKIHIATPQGRQEELDEIQVRAEWQAGGIPRGSLYWKEGMTGWLPLAGYLGDTVDRPAQTPAAATPPAAPVSAAPAADPNAPLNPYAAPAYQAEPSAATHPHGTYAFLRNPRRLTNVLTVFLTVCLLTGIAALVLQVSQYFLLGRPFTPEEGESNDRRIGQVGILHLITYLSTSIVFAKWIHRAAVNSRGFGAQGMSDTPGWAVGWYLVPIMNLFRPYQAMKEIWQVSEHPIEWKNHSGSAILTVWWGFWIASSAVPTMAKAILSNASTIPGFQAATIVTIAGNLCYIALTIAAVRLTRTLTRRQEHLVARSAE